jgi:hypothetical protein
VRVRLFGKAAAAFSLFLESRQIHRLLPTEILGNHPPTLTQPFLSDLRPLAASSELRRHPQPICAG